LLRCFIGKIAKQVCNKGTPYGISIDVIGKIPSTAPSLYTSRSIMVLLYATAELCLSRMVAPAIEAVLAPKNQCLYSYYGDMKYSYCSPTNAFNGTHYLSRDGTCSKNPHSFQHLPSDPCSSGDVNLDATYAGYYHYLCL
jgi:hypothetical protein